MSHLFICRCKIGHIISGRTGGRGTLRLFRLQVAPGMACSAAEAEWDTSSIRSEASLVAMHGWQVVPEMKPPPIQLMHRRRGEGQAIHKMCRRAVHRREMCARCYATRRQRRKGSSAQEVQRQSAAKAKGI